MKIRLNQYVYLVLLSLMAFNVYGQKEKKWKPTQLEVYMTPKAFTSSSDAIKISGEAFISNNQYIHIKKFPNSDIGKRSKNTVPYGIKYKDKKYYNMYRTECDNQYQYFPLEIEGFFGLMLISKKTSNHIFPHQYAKADYWEDKNGNLFHVMILEPNIPTSLNYNIGFRSKSKCYFGNYATKNRIKKYNKKYDFNYDKKSMKVEDWIILVKTLNERHQNGKL